MGSIWDDEPTKRTLGIRERQILWERAGHKCESCGKELDFTEMQTGHKTAASKGGSATLKNCVCLCYRCNKLQGTDSWKTFLKKMGKQPEDSKTKDSLKGLSMRQLKFLAKKHHVKVKGRLEEGFLEDYRVAPTKKQYIKTLAGVVSEEGMSSELQEMPQTVRKKRRSSDSLW